MRPRSFIGAGCALLLLAPALAFSQSSPPGRFMAVDSSPQPVWSASGAAATAATEVTIAVNDSVTIGYEGNASHHYVEFMDSPQPACNGVQMEYNPQRQQWSGTCKFTRAGTYEFKCPLHDYGTEFRMRGKVHVVAPVATPTPTATADPTPQPGATATPTPTPQATPRQTALAVRVASAQRGTRVRGRVVVAQAGSRLEVTVLRGRVRAGRSVKTASAGTATFSVPLNAKARRALRSRGRLDVKVRVALTPPGGTKISRDQRVRLRR